MVAFRNFALFSLAFPGNAQVEFMSLGCFANSGLDMLKGPAGFFCSNWKRLAGFLCLSKIRQPQQKKGGQNLGKRF